MIIGEESSIGLSTYVFMMFFISSKMNEFSSYINLNTLGKNHLNKNKWFYIILIY